VRVATVVIVGAGDAGAELARQIAVADVVSRVVLIDNLGQTAAGKALDIAQSAPVDGYATSVIGTNDVSAVVGAAVVVLADRAGQTPGEWRDDGGLTLIGRVAGLNQVAPIVCMGTMQWSLVERGVNELGIPRHRLFGSAPEALRSAVVTICALEAGAAPSDVSLSVLGRPSSVIVPWDTAAIAGRAATHVLSAAQLARLDARVARLWPPGPFTLAAAAARMIHSAITRGPRVHMAQVAVTRSEGALGRSAMMPVLLEPAGIRSLVTPSLSSRDRVRFETTLRME